MEVTTSPGRVVWGQGTTVVLWGPTEIGSWTGQYLAAMDNACLPSLCGQGIPIVLLFCGRIIV